MKKYGLWVLIIVISIIISNLRINFMEKKFNNLYNGLDNVKAVATVISRKNETN